MPLQWPALASGNAAIKGRFTCNAWTLNEGDICIVGRCNFPGENAGWSLTGVVAPNHLGFWQGVFGHIGFYQSHQGVIRGESKNRISLACLSFLWNKLLLVVFFFKKPL